MLLLIIRILYAVICAGVIASLVSSGNLTSVVNDRELFWFFGIFLITQAFTLVDVLLPRKRLDVISSIYFGLLIGVVLTYLLSAALGPLGINPNIESALRALSLVVFSYVCISLLLQTRDDFRFVIPYVEFVKEVKGGRPLIIDTSSLIDGRVADIMETKIIDTELVVPSFVLKELQDVADSNDKLRRTRGRRGLDVLTKMQQNPKVEIRVYEVKDKEGEGQTVDQRIVSLAKHLGGRVLTNDFNLNKVASVQGVDVVNLNDVANALKPRYLPGEQLHIKVIREGEGMGQGVGYLDDGTMVICEQAAGSLGRDVEVIVTSVLQNSAGRMIFSRLASSMPPGGR